MYNETYIIWNLILALRISNRFVARNLFCRQFGTTRGKWNRNSLTAYRKYSKNYSFFSWNLEKNGGVRTFRRSHSSSLRILFLSHATFSAMVTMQKIHDVYEDVLKVSKRQRWFRRFAGRSFVFDNYIIKSSVEAYPKLSIKKLSRSLASRRSPNQTHLHVIVKLYKRRVSAPHQLSETSSRLFIGRFALHCRIDFVGIQFIAQ